MKVYRRTMPNGQQSPTFYVSYQVRGKRIIKSTGCTTRREAEEAARSIVEPLRQQKEETAARAIAEKHLQVVTGARKIALHDAWTEFMQTKRGGRAGEKQAKANARRWADFGAFMADKYPGVTQLVGVTTEHVETYLDRLKDKGPFIAAQEYRRGRDTVRFSRGECRLSMRTINSFRDTLRMVFGALARTVGLTTNPVSAVVREPTSYAPRDAFTVDDIRDMGRLAREADPFVYPLLAVAANTGLRLGDCATLRWAEVDLQEKIIRRTMRKTKRLVEVPIFSPGFHAYLDELRSKAKPNAEFVLPEHARMYATNADGLSYRMKKFLAEFEKKRPEADRRAISETVDGRTRKVSRRDWHSIRHAFLTIAGGAGVPPQQLQRLAGHTTLAMTGRYLDHADLALLRQRMANMPDPLGLSTPAPAALPAPVVDQEQAARIGAALARLDKDDVPAAVRSDLRRILGG